MREPEVGSALQQLLDSMPPEMQRRLRLQDDEAAQEEQNTDVRFDFIYRFCCCHVESLGQGSALMRLQLYQGAHRGMNSRCECRHTCCLLSNTRTVAHSCDVCRREQAWLLQRR